jgi:carboxypeptidase family protein
MSSVSGRVRRGSRLGVLFILLAPFCAAVPAFAQLPTGTFLGTVKDSSGALVPGANVTAREQETGTSRSIATDSSGEYRLAGLPPGHYDLTVDAAGFKTATETGVVLDVSSQVSLNFELQVGTTTQKVVVSGEAPLVDTTSASLGGLVNEEKIEDLPLNGRNFLDLALQQPGIRPLASSAER